MPLWKALVLLSEQRLFHAVPYYDPLLFSALSGDDDDIDARLHGRGKKGWAISRKLDETILVYQSQIERQEWFLPTCSTA